MYLRQKNTAFLEGIGISQFNLVISSDFNVIFCFEVVYLAAQQPEFQPWVIRW